MIAERTRTGMERAKREGKRIGRPTNLNEGLIQSIKYMRSQGLGIRKIATDLKVGVGTIYRVIEQQERDSKCCSQTSTNVT